MENKFISLSAVAFLLSVFASACSNTDTSIKTLTIYNWQDYIFEGDEDSKGTIELFKDYYYQQTGERINVEYYTFETNENMLNVLKTGKAQYDLVCPSDYIIQKMIVEDMVEPLNKDLVPNYTKNASPFVQNVFEKNTIKKADGTTVSWADYAIPYFWGTMGFMYNPENILNETDINSWSILWNKDYKGKFTLKDSVRDTYCVGVLYAYSDLKHPEVNYSLNELASMYEKGEITGDEYQSYVQTIMNDISDETLELVKNKLQEAKDNSYGFEVDSGKTDIVTGKIDINFCWSGDAVYAMDLAEEENDMYLNYTIPEEGSNIWFDGWVMPKGANKELAHAFLNFISQSNIASLNMNEVGYTSSIAGDDIYDMVIDWYGSESVYDENGNIAIDETTLQTKLANNEIYEYDLSYFFDNTLTDTSKKAIFYSDEIGRQFSAQYPSSEEINRCAVMEDFGDRNEKVIEMWIQIKANPTSPWVWILIGVVVIAVGGFVIYKSSSKKARKSRTRKTN